MSQFHWKFVFPRKQQTENKTRNETPTTMQSPRECGGGGLWPIPRTIRSRASWQRREHACQPSEGEGNVCSIGWRYCKVKISINEICDKYAQPIELGENWPEEQPPAEKKHGSLTGRWGRLMIFALAILRVFLLPSRL